MSQPIDQTAIAVIEPSPAEKEAVRRTVRTLATMGAVRDRTKITVGRKLTPSAIQMYMPGSQLQSVPRDPGRETEILELLKLLRDFDPDAAMAVWNLLRIANPGHHVSVKDFGDRPHQLGQTKVDALAKRLWKPGGGGADTFIDTVHLSFFTYGGAGAEVVVTQNLLDVRDVYPFSPADIEFRYLPSEQEGGDPQLLMFPARSNIAGLGGGDIDEALSPLQTFYLPLDPDVDDPYGRPPMLPAVSALLASMNLINRIQQVAEIHGYGQRDVTILLDAIIEAAPESIKSPGQEVMLAAWINGIRAQVEQDLKDIKPTDTFVHFDNMQVNTTSPGGIGMNVDAIMRELSRRAVTALKSMPLLLGNAEQSGAQSTVQWQIFVKGIKAIQSRSKRLLESIYNTSLRVWGINATCTVTYNDIKETDRAIEAAAVEAEFGVSEKLYRAGLISYLEWGQKMVGHQPVGPRPPTQAEEFAGTQLQNEVDPTTVESEAGQLGAAAPGVAQPGTDASITAEEGAALDFASTGVLNVGYATASRMKRRAGPYRAELQQLQRDYPDVYDWLEANFDDYVGYQGWHLILANRAEEEFYGNPDAGTGRGNIDLRNLAWKAVEEMAYEKYGTLYPGRTARRTQRGKRSLTPGQLGALEGWWAENSDVYLDRYPDPHVVAASDALDDLGISNTPSNLREAWLLFADLCRPRDYTNEDLTGPELKDIVRWQKGISGNSARPCRALRRSTRRRRGTRAMYDPEKVLGKFYTMVVAYIEAGIEDAYESALRRGLGTVQVGWHAEFAEDILDGIESDMGDEVEWDRGDAFEVTWALVRLEADKRGYKAALAWEHDQAADLIGRTGMPGMGAARRYLDPQDRQFVLDYVAEQARWYMEEFGRASQTGEQFGWHGEMADDIVRELGLNSGSDWREVWTLIRREAVRLGLNSPDYDVSADATPDWLRTPRGARTRTRHSRSYIMDEALVKLRDYIDANIDDAEVKGQPGWHFDFAWQALEESGALKLVSGGEAWVMVRQEAERRQLWPWDGSPSGNRALKTSHYEDSGYASLGNLDSVDAGFTNSARHARRRGLRLRRSVGARYLDDYPSKAAAMQAFMDYVDAEIEANERKNPSWHLDFAVKARDDTNTNWHIELDEAWAIVRVEAQSRGLWPWDGSPSGNDMLKKEHYSSAGSPDPTTIDDEILMAAWERIVEAGRLRRAVRAMRTGKAERAYSEHFDSKADAIQAFMDYVDANIEDNERKYPSWHLEFALQAIDDTGTYLYVEQDQAWSIVRMEAEARGLWPWDGSASGEAMLKNAHYADAAHPGKINAEIIAAANAGVFGNSARKGHSRRTDKRWARLNPQQRADLQDYIDANIDDAVRADPGWHLSFCAQALDAVTGGWYSDDDLIDAWILVRETAASLGLWPWDGSATGDAALKMQHYEDAGEPFRPMRPSRSTSLSRSTKGRGRRSLWRELADEVEALLIEDFGVDPGGPDVELEEMIEHAYTKLYLDASNPTVQRVVKMVAVAVFSALTGVGSEAVLGQNSARHKRRKQASSMHRTSMYANIGPNNDLPRAEKWQLLLDYVDAELPDRVTHTYDGWHLDLVEDAFRALGISSDNPHSLYIDLWHYIEDWSQEHYGTLYPSGRYLAPHARRTTQRRSLKREVKRSTAPNGGEALVDAAHLFGEGAVEKTREFFRQGAHTMLLDLLDAATLEKGAGPSNAHALWGYVLDDDNDDNDPVTGGEP